MTNRSPAFALTCLCLFLLAPAALARDFPLPLEFTNPFALASSSTGPSGALVPGGVADLGYHDYTFSGGPYDLFSMRQRISVAPYVGRRVGFVTHYGTYLMVGPVPRGDDPFSVARWVMNTVQFEYGVTAGFRGRSLTVLAGYGRTSQHPLVSGGFSEIASDILELELHARSFVFRRLDARAGIRFAYLDLFDFWQSPLLAPRTLIRIGLPIEVTGSVGSSRVVPVARLYPRLLVMRRTGVWPYADVDPPVQLELDAEAGLRLVGRAYAELLLELYTTGDSERRAGAPAPLTTFGVTVRAGIQARP